MRAEEKERGDPTVPPSRLGDRMDAETCAVQADSFIYPPHKPLPKKRKRQ